MALVIPHGAGVQQSLRGRGIKGGSQWGVDLAQTKRQGLQLDMDLAWD
jgi:hypothetical protein